MAEVNLLSYLLYQDGDGVSEGDGEVDGEVDGDGDGEVGGVLAMW